MKPVVVQCDALSYSGTTWLNLCLGTHEKALTIGPPHGLWAAKDTGLSEICQVHGETCQFWADFDATWDRAENFFTALMEFSGKTHFIFDNPPAEFVDAYMQPADVDLKRLRYVRDARAITASYARKVPATSFYDSILPDGWFYHSFMAIPTESESSGAAYVRYEDCAQNLPGFLAKAASHIGLDYTGQNTRFWEADHHITSGNTGPINMVRLHQGLAMPNFESKAVYEEQYNKLVANPDDTFFDERWRKQLTREDLFYFDLLLGEQNAKLGYERDVFTDAEIREFWIAYGPSVNNGERKALPHAVMCEGQSRFNATSEASINVRVVPDTPVDDTPVPAEKIAAVHDADKWVNETGNRVYPETIYVTDPNEAGIRQMVPPIGPGIRKLLEPTTQYYDGVEPDQFAALGPYQTESGPYDKKALEELVVNANMHAGYGPDYLVKHPLALTVDPLTRYRDLLEGLQANSNITFKTYQEGLAKTPDANEICGLIRHDVDGDLMAALDMAKIENALGIKSTYFLLHTAPYYGIMQNGVFMRNEAALATYLEIQALGHEVAVHTDALELYQNHKVDGAKGLVTELEWLRDNGLKISGTLAHNSFNVYGANNYTIFEGRPLTDYYYPGPSKAVTHNGRWSPLQMLKEDELGLVYEGNDVFWQDETNVRYYALMHQAMWYRTENLYGTLQHVFDRPKGVSSWISQDEVIDDARHIPMGDYAVIVVHPLHYGTRANKLDNPSHTITRALGKKKAWLKAVTAPIGDKARLHRTDVNNGDDNDAVIVSGHLGDRVEFTSVHVPDELGGSDRPIARLAEGDVRFVFTGHQNFASKTIPSDSKLSQLTVSLLKHSHGLHSIEMRAASFCPDSLDGLTLAAFIDGLDTAQKPNIVIAGLGQEDLEASGEGSLLDYLNVHAGTDFTVFGVVERSGQDGIAVDQALTDSLRARANFQVFDPYTVFEHYGQQGTGTIFWQSVSEWAYQAHYITARMLSDGLVNFVKLLKDQMEQAA